MLTSEIFAVDAGGRCAIENALKGLRELLSEESMSMLDFDDVSSLFDGESEAYILSGDGQSENAIVDAVNMAINSAAAEKIMPRARSIFLNIESSSESFSMFAIHEVSTLLTEAAHPDVEILWNVTINPEMADRVHVILVVSRLAVEPEVFEESTEPVAEFKSDGEESILTKIRTDLAPAAVGPYSQAIEVNGFVYCSGQIAIDPAVGKIVATDIVGQAERCCLNVEAVLAAAGAEIKNVVKTTCFLVDIADFAKFNAVYERHFIGKPARSCVAVSALPAGALCEIEVVAVK